MEVTRRGRWLSLVAMVALLVGLGPMAIRWWTGSVVSAPEREGELRAARRVGVGSDVATQRALEPEAIRDSFRDRLKVAGASPAGSGIPARSGSRVENFRETTEAMLRRIPEVATDPVAIRVVSNALANGRGSWLEGHARLSDAALRELESRDIASSEVFTRQGVPFRELLQEFSAPEAVSDYLLRTSMEVAENHANWIGKEGPFVDDPRDDAETRAVFARNRTQDAHFYAEIREAYLAAMKVELAQYITDVDGFLARLLAIPSPPKVPPLGYDPMTDR